nr:putative ribonuclease H-like domain-containing protein [Tanacetum cinerariifolium]
DSVVDATKKATEVDESRVSENGGQDDHVIRIQQKSDEIFISQEKYVDDILKKFDFTTVKITSTLIEPNKALVKDAKAEDVDVHLYRSMTYLTASRLDITFAVCACVRFQVTPKTSHLYAVKRIFRYLKGQPKLGLWYPRDSPFDLEAYSDSDYAGASLDRKSTTEGCQFLGKRLISLQCKKQTIVANSTTKAEYVAATSCCGQAYTYCCQMKVNAAKHRLTTAVKNVNGDVRLQALVDGKKVIVNEASIRRDIRLDDAEGTACLSNDAIFEGLERMRGSTNQKGNRGRQLRFLTLSHKLRKEYIHLPMIHYPMGRIKDQDLFRVHDLDGDEVFVDVINGENVEQDATVPESVKGIAAAITL